ncbi:RNA polymerase-associated protein rtf1, partial [Nowakowskiella sp. JEL0078]
VVDYHKPYQLEETTVKKGLLVVHGSAKKLFRMDLMSNSGFTEAEWGRYVNQMQRDKEKLIHKGELKKKREELEKIRNHTLTSVELDLMIKAKKELKKIPANISSEKIQTQLDLEAAQQRGDDEKAKKLKSRLQELEDIIKENKRREAERLARNNTSKLAGINQYPVKNKS